MYFLAHMRYTKNHHLTGGFSMSIHALPDRRDADPAYTWDLTPLYLDTAAFEADLSAAQKDLPALTGYEGHLADSPDSLYAYLAEKDRQLQRITRLYHYAFQKCDEDTADPDSQALKGRAFRLYMDFESATAYEGPEILSFPEGLLETFFKDAPALKMYRRYLEDITRMKAHTLSHESEQLLSLSMDMSASIQNIFNMFNNADIRFPSITDEKGNTVEITHGRFIALMESRDRNVRKAAFSGLYSAYKAHAHTLAAAYQTNAKKELFYTRARKYASSLEARLDVSDIPVSVYDRLIEAVHRHLPAMYRYVALRKKLLGVDALHMYDIYTPIIPYEYPSFKWDEAQAAVLHGLSPLGEDYVRRLKTGFRDRWIDVYENRGKRGGAYSTCAYGVHPYVLMNFQGKLNDVFTLAHEMGHALHSCFTNETQPFVYSDYSIFVAEIASTCNEALLMESLLSQASDAGRKAYLLNYFLDQFKSTLFRQTMFAEFEKITHEMEARGQALTAKALCQVYHDLNQTYFGPDMVVDEAIDMEWARIPHFYTPFYVYQYATGFSAAIAFSSHILKEGAPAVADYTRFLKSGCRETPIRLLKDCGVDMTTPAPIETALERFEDILSQLEDLLPEARP